MKSTIFRVTGLGQEIQDISFLLAQGHNCRQDTLNKKAALFTLRAKTALSPNNAAAQRSFSRVIGRFNPFMIYECPQSRLKFEDVSTGLARGGVIDQRTNLQQVSNIHPNGLDKRGEVGSFQGSIADPAPVTKQKWDLLEKQLTDHLGLTPSIVKGLKIPFQMRPTDLSAHRVEAQVGCPAIRTQDVGESFTQQALDPFTTAGGQQRKDGHQVRCTYPQPGLFAHLMPARFIHIPVSYTHL